MAAKTYLKTTLEISLFLVVLTFSSTAHAKTIHVDDDSPADFNNIQAAIDNANDGDIVILNPGTYTGDGNRDIDFKGKAITVRSIDPNDPNIVAATIINCKGTKTEPHRGFIFENSESDTSILDGITITNGYGHDKSIEPFWYWPSCGGAISCVGSSPKVSNCMILSNSSVSGGGFFCYNASPIIINCIIYGNASESYGGGIYCFYYSHPMITYCVINGNSSGNEGSAIHYMNGSSATIRNCIMSSNLSYGYYGSVLHCNYSSIYGGGHGTIANCIISKNIGAGIYCSEDSPLIINCTIVWNYGTKPTCAGINNRHGKPLVVNCIVWNNFPNQIFDISAGIPVAYCNVQDSWLGEGNIDAVPLFVDPGYWDVNGTPYDANDDVWVDGDYHLLSDSPCIDSGDPNYVAEPNETDLDGRPRVTSGRIDMGAYEAPIFAEARILPRTINLTSKGRWITCYIRLSDDYDVADIDPSSVLLERQIKPEQFYIDEQQQVATARFSREDVQPILDVGEVELTITGRLTDGTPFEAIDTIKVIEGGGKK
ncbi:MAG: right-handed parallel beta-helix repeat-containing protein [Planctomycetota bacterium]|jgi:hypothetical protein